MLSLRKSYVSIKNGESMYDEKRSLLVDQCSSTPTEEFWGKVPTDIYPTLVAFAKAMLTIPVSNVDCERVFSQVNLIKTEHRNRFSTEGVYGSEDAGNDARY